MPFTPYHFGPSGFIGLLLRKWIDIPVFVLANVIVDVEVLFFDRWPVHRYFHTLLLGALVGACWGFLAYRLRGVFTGLMRILQPSYQTGLWKMVVSGVLGVWLHVVIDAIYHWDVKIFWPSKARPLYGLLSQGDVKLICVGFLVAAVVYAFVLAARMKRGNVRKSVPEAD